MVNTLKILKKMGVRVGVDKMVQGYKDNIVYFKGGDSIETETLIWTAGVTGMKFDGIPDDCYGKGSRLLVDKYNKVKGTDNIYAIGDACLQKTDEDYPKGHPQLASVAMQQGKHLAKNFTSRSRGESLSPFHYNDKGTMAIIGMSKAVADLTTPSKTFTGKIALMMWLFIHLLELIGYRSRIQTMWDWTTAYIAKDQSLGMIVRPTPTAGSESDTLSEI